MADESVDHPAHYGGENDPYEVIKVAEAWGFDADAYLFNVLKYIRREKDDKLEDLKKARFYLDRKIKRMEGTCASHAAALTPEDNLWGAGLDNAMILRNDDQKHYRTVEVKISDDPFASYTINAHVDWTVEALAGIVATVAGFSGTGTYGITTEPVFGDPVLGAGTVQWLLGAYPPGRYNYYLSMPKTAPVAIRWRDIDWGEGDKLAEVAPLEGCAEATWRYSDGGDVWYLIDGFSFAKPVSAVIDRSARSLSSLVETFGPLKVTQGAYTGMTLNPDGYVSADGTE
jgi:hypothetical protein